MTTDLRQRGGPPTVRPPATARRDASGGAPRATARGRREHGGGADGARDVRPAPPRPDPRIAARRIAVRRDEGRRRLRRLGAVAALVGVVTLVVALTRTPLLDVDAVHVRGAERLSVAAVREALAGAGVATGTALVDVDAGDAERALEALPAVASAEVRRDWPGAVVVTVEERRPVGAVRVGDAVAIVAADGVVLEVLDGPPAAIPVLEGAQVEAEPGAVADGAAVLAVAAALPPNVAPGVDAVVAAGGGEVGLRLAAGVRARLGPPEDLEEKLTALVTVLANADPACIASVDVRVPTAPAVTPARGCGT